MRATGPACNSTNAEPSYVLRALVGATRMSAQFRAANDRDEVDFAASLSSGHRQAAAYRTGAGCVTSDA